MRFFEITDANKASALSARGIGYRGCYLTPDRKVVFKFVPDERIEDILSDYDYNLDGSRSLLEARSFIQSQIKDAYNRQSRNSGGVK